VFADDLAAELDVGRHGIVEPGSWRIRRETSAASALSYRAISSANDSAVTSRSITLRPKLNRRSRANSPEVTNGPRPPRRRG